MSLDPAWYSGLFGGYFVVSTLYIGFCLLSLLTVRANARGHASIPPAAVQDVAKLQFAISIMWMYFFWSQYLVIWYGNVPVETRFFLTRFFTQPWLTLAWFVLVVGWLIPFAYLLKRLTGRPPQRHAPLVVVSVFGLVAIFLERVVVVFPSVSPSARAAFGARSRRGPIRRWTVTQSAPTTHARAASSWSSSAGSSPGRCPPGHCGRARRCGSSRVPRCPTERTPSYRRRTSPPTASASRSRGPSSAVRSCGRREKTSALATSSSRRARRSPPPSSASWPRRATRACASTAGPASPCSPRATSSPTSASSPGRARSRTRTPTR